MYVQISFQNMYSNFFPKYQALEMFLLLSMTAFQPCNSTHDAYKGAEMGGQNLGLDLNRKLIWWGLTCKSLWLPAGSQYLHSFLLAEFFFVVFVQSPSCVWLFATPWTEAGQASLSLTISWNLPKFIASVMPSSHLMLWCPLLLPSIFPSIRDFSNESSIRIKWPKWLSFSFSISPSSEY